MEYSHVILLTIALITVFGCFFGWCLMKSCRRVIDAEVYELKYQRDVEAEGVKSGGGGSNNAGGGSSVK